MAENMCSFCGAPLRELVDGACPFCRVPVTGGGPAGFTRGASTAIVLEDPGRNKIAVIKAVRELTGYGLKEAKDLVEAADRGPALIATGLDEQLAQRWVDLLSDAGAAVSARPAG